MRHKPFPGKSDLVAMERCPICKSGSILDIGTPVSHEATPIHYNRCKACDLIFMNPRPTQAWYNSLYQAEFWEVKQQKKNRRSQVKNQVVKEALWAEKFISVLDEVHFGATRKSPCILEIGCAYGVIGKLIAQHYSGKAFGVEPSDAARDFAEKVSGVRIFGENMDQLIQGDESEVFDLVIFSHVLENITDPQQALQAASRLLKPDGVLLIDTPNNFFRRSWHIHHPYCFTPPAIRKLLASASFEILASRSSSRPRYVIGQVYLTVAAVKAGGHVEYVASSWKVWLSKAVGHLTFSILNIGPVRRLNKLIARKVWGPGKATQEEIAKIISQVDK